MLTKNNAIGSEYTLQSKSRLMRKTAAITRADRMKASLFIKKNPTLLQYFPSLNQDIMKKLDSNTFQPSNDNTGLAGDVALLNELIAIYQDKGIKPDDASVAEDYETFITGAGTAREIVNKYSNGQQKILNRDIELADALLAKYPIITRTFTNIKSLIENKILQLSNAGFVADIEKLRDLALLIVKNHADATIPDIMQALNDGQTIPEVYRAYAKSIATSYTPSPTSTPKSTTYQPTSDSTSTTKTRSYKTKTRRNGDQRSEKSEEVIRRIYRMLKGEITKKVIDAKIENLNQGLRALNALCPNFTERMKRMDRDGFPTWAPGQAENGIIQLIKFSLKMYEYGANKVQHLSDQITSIFNQWFNGTPLSNMKLNSKEVRDTVKYVLNVQQMQEQGQEALYGTEANNMFDKYGFKFIVGTKPFNDVQKVEQWFDKFAKQLDIYRNLLPNDAIQEFLNLQELWETIQNHLVQLYADLVIRQNREKKYYDKAEEYWFQNSQVKTLLNYVEGRLQLKMYVRLPKEKTISEDMPEGFNTAIWKEFTPEEKNAVNHIYELYNKNAAIIGNNGLIIPLAVAAVALSTGNFFGMQKGSFTEAASEQFEIKLSRYLQNDNIKGAVEFRKRFLSQLLADIRKQIEIIYNRLKSMLPNTAVKALDTSSDPFSWLNQFTSRIDANINELLQEETNLFYPNDIFAAMFNAALASAGDYVHNRIDKTKEDFKKKLKRLQESEIAPYTEEFKGPLPDARRTPDTPYGSPFSDRPFSVKQLDRLERERNASLSNNAFRRLARKVD